ncbi:MAG: hypothetical protein AAGM67_17040, partial [Bacteroidota bacterium]
VFQIDWAHNAEFGEAANNPALLQTLAEQTDYVLLQRNKEEQWYQDERYGCLLAGAVAEHWDKVLETKYFELYRPAGSGLEVSQ